MGADAGGDALGRVTSQAFLDQALGSLRRRRGDDLQQTVHRLLFDDAVGFPAVGTALDPAAFGVRGAGIDAGQFEELNYLVMECIDGVTLGERMTGDAIPRAETIRLATQIGSKLMGVLYVLDEPSIGLHPRDINRLVALLRRLRDDGPDYFYTGAWAKRMVAAVRERGGLMTEEDLANFNQAGIGPAWKPGSVQPS